MPHSAGDKCTQEGYQDCPDGLVRVTESPVPKTEHVSRTLLSRILCNPDEDFATPILDVSTNPHITTLVSGGIRVCLWQNPVKKGANIKSVLSEIVHAGHELLAEFIGTCCNDHFKRYILLCTETTFCTEGRSP
jgi:hypothetical protein